jgi:hypothetical protein
MARFLDGPFFGWPVFWMARFLDGPFFGWPVFWMARFLDGFYNEFRLFEPFKVTAHG